MTVITYVFPHGQVLYKQGKIVTVGGTANWNLVQSIEVPEDFRPLNMPYIPIVSSNGIEFTSYSDGIIGKDQTNYWRLFHGISWITN